MARPRHPNKEIEAAVCYAVAQGWRWHKATAHAWGRLLCPHAARDGCKMSVNSTPKHPQGHADKIKKFVDRCPHKVKASKPKAVEKKQSNRDKSNGKGKRRA